MENISERSVINMGQGSYIITLPKAWVRCFGIKPKDKLTVIADKDLIIRTQKRGGNKKVNT